MVLVGFYCTIFCLHPKSATNIELQKWGKKYWFVYRSNCCHYYTLVVAESTKHHTWINVNISLSLWHHHDKLWLVRISMDHSAKSENLLRKIGFFLYFLNDMCSNRLNFPYEKVKIWYFSLIFNYAKNEIGRTLSALSSTTESILWIWCMPNDISASSFIAALLTSSIQSHGWRAQRG